MTGSPSHAYSLVHLAERVRLHGAEVDVVEPVVVAAVAERERPLHPHRPVLEVERTQVMKVDLLAEHAADLQVDVGDRDDDVGRVAMGHHEPRVGERPVELVEEEQVCRALEPPRPRRRAPLQQLEGAPFVRGTWR